jgi:feruloyl esterase
MIAGLLALLLSGQSGAQQGSCAALSTLLLPDVKISEAVAIPAPATGVVRVAHCKVNGTIGKEIRFTLLLPDQWNHKFVMGGGGGYVAGIDNQAAASVNDGYATVGTDTGHQGGLTDASWGLNNIERQLNFGHLAVHRVAEVSKAIIRHHYGAAASRSYFNGCSNGGRQALMEAQRYPDDFDGIISGAPAYDFTGLAAQFVKDIQVAFPTVESLSTPVFPAAVLKNIEQQIIAKCDAIDGVTDGLMEDPRRCTVDVASLTDLTDQQKKALQVIYGEKKLPDGSVIYTPQPFGGEGDGSGWDMWIAGVNPMIKTAMKIPSLRWGFGTQFFKTFVFNDPSWDYLAYDFKNYRKDSALAASMLNATDPNLDAFKARGGKLVMYHGWSDPALSAIATTKYYEQVQARDPKAGDFTRLFMMPGMLHCTGGAGPDRVDWNAVLDTWVEKGSAPDRVVATKVTAGKVTRSRPLCPYPMHAVYKGTGSIDDEQSFSCSK